MQQKKIENLTQLLDQQSSRSEQLSNLVLLYQNQITQMNNSNNTMVYQIQEIQNELSTIDLWFQFEFDLIQQDKKKNQQFQTILEQVPDHVSSRTERIKQYVQGLQERISFMDRQISFNEEDYKQNLFMIKDKLEQCLLFHCNQKDYCYSFQQNINYNTFKSYDDKNIYQSLCEIVQKIIGVFINFKRERNEQNEKITYKIEQEQMMKYYEKIKNDQQTEFQIKLNNLQSFIKKLKKQQALLEQEIFKIRINKKRINYRKLEKKLECKFMHNSKEIEKEILNSLKNRNLQQCPDDQKNHKSNQQKLNEQLNLNQEKVKQQPTSNHSDCIEKKRFKKASQNRTLYSIVTNQHEHLKAYKSILLQFLKLSDWLECCIEVDSQGNLIFEESFLTEINSPDLIDWAQTFKKNILISIQQHIKRQVDTKIDIPICDRIKLKQLIYTGNYNKYFRFLIQMLSNNKQQNQIR